MKSKDLINKIEDSIIIKNSLISTTQIISLTSTTLNQEKNIQNNQIQTDIVNNLNKYLNLNLNNIISTTPSNLLGLPFPVPNRCKFKRFKSD